MSNKEEEVYHAVFHTPKEVVISSLREIVPHIANTRFALDAGAGTGIWGYYLKSLFPGLWLDGVEIRNTEPNTYFDAWYNQSFDDSYIETIGDRKYDIIVGNPPFNLAQEFVRTGYKLLEKDGIMVFLLRLSFLSSKERVYKSKKYDVALHQDIPIYKVLVIAPRPAFVRSVTGAKKSDNRTDYGIFIWKKDYEGFPTIGWVVAEDKE